MMRKMCFPRLEKSNSEEWVVWAFHVMNSPIRIIVWDLSWGTKDKNVADETASSPALSFIADRVL